MKDITKREIIDLVNTCNFKLNSVSNDAINEVLGIIKVMSLICKNDDVNDKIKDKSNSTIYLESQLNKSSDEVNYIYKIYLTLQQEIIKILVKNDELITHIDTRSDKYVNEEQNGYLMVSNNRDNTFRTNRGNWFFASIDNDKDNSFFLRTAGNPFIHQNELIFTTNIYDIKDNRLLMKKPNYVYYINPKDFLPVITIVHDGTKARFVLSRELITTKNININDASIVKKIDCVKDVTYLLDKFQVFFYKDGYIINKDIFKKLDESNDISLIKEDYLNGKIVYVNSILKINEKEDPLNVNGHKLK